MKLSLIAKDSHQNRGARQLLDLKAQRFQRSKERLRQLTADAHLVGKALSASVHDCGFWLVPIEVLIDMRPPHMLTRRVVG
jgi:hypothetical protein